ncbi:MAG TPA: ABC transporter ATP-binding protein [Prolixibacteraceae bacterium]|nr:ABC transporter ATP-binding protein [Prolixibacteraceae bacterium]
MIRAGNIEKSYGGQKALKGITLEVGEGEIFGLIGPDGAGKTTLMRILVTLLLPDKGFATLDGMDVVADFRKIRKMVGYMPGRFSLYPDLTVAENLQFFATVFGGTVEANYHLIRDIYSQIEPFRNRPAGKLSGGMKQKLALSCALIHAPKVLILDEPTTGVDAVSRKEFWEMLNNLRHNGITIMVSTPYMDEANLCDRVALFQNGNILSINTPAKITASFTRKMLGVKVLNTSQRFECVRLLKEMKGVVSVFSFGDVIHVTLSRPDINEKIVREYLSSRGQQGVTVGVISAGIEDVFMELMQHDGK